MIEPKWSEADGQRAYEWHGAYSPRFCAIIRSVIEDERARILAEIAKHNDVPEHVLRWLVPLVAEGRKP